LARSALAVAALVVATLALSGCDVLEPTRDAEGHIVKPTSMASTDAWVGDCFSFVENSNLAYVSVVPCADAHSHVVVSRGKLSATKVELAGGVENAVRTVCDSAFTLYEASLGEDADPEQSSIVSTKNKAGGVVTYYSCIATDAVVLASN